MESVFNKLFATKDFNEMVNILKTADCDFQDECQPDAFASYLIRAMKTEEDALVIVELYKHMYGNDRIIICREASECEQQFLTLLDAIESSAYMYDEDLIPKYCSLADALVKAEYKRASECDPRLLWHLYSRRRVYARNSKVDSERFYHSAGIYQSLGRQLGIDTSNMEMMPKAQKPKMGIREFIDDLTFRKSLTGKIHLLKNTDFVFQNDAQPESIIMRVVPYIKTYDDALLVAKTIKELWKGDIILCRELTFCMKKFQTLLDAVEDMMYNEKYEDRHKYAYLTAAMEEYEFKRANECNLRLLWHSMKRYECYRKSLYFLVHESCEQYTKLRRELLQYFLHPSRRHRILIA